VSPQLLDSLYGELTRLRLPYGRAAGQTPQPAVEASTADDAPSATADPPPPSHAHPPHQLAAPPTRPPPRLPRTGPRPPLFSHSAPPPPPPPPSPAAPKGLEAALGLALLAETLAALAAQRHAPSAAWASQVAAALRPKLPQLPPPQLLALLACWRLRGEAPEAKWLAAAEAALAAQLRDAATGPARGPGGVGRAVEPGLAAALAEELSRGAGVRGAGLWEPGEPPAPGYAHAGELAAAVAELRWLRTAAAAEAARGTA
jgi:hypothetical protein